jgi:hypothetical protein
MRRPYNTRRHVLLAAHPQGRVSREREKFMKTVETLPIAAVLAALAEYYGSQRQLAHVLAVESQQIHNMIRRGGKVRPALERRARELYAQAEHPPTIACPHCGQPVPVPPA